MFTRLARAILWGPALALIPLGAGAHEIVGNRFFPATLVADDPGVNDELSLPTASLFKTSDVPSVNELDIAVEFSKRITDDFALIVQPTWTHLYVPGGPLGNGASGFQNLETTAKYRLYKNGEHEFIVSSALWPNGPTRGRSRSQSTRSPPTRRRST